MFSLNTLFVVLLIAVVQTAASSDKCNAPSDIPDADECCELPVFFSTDELESCGLKDDLAPMLGQDDDFNSTCDPFICLLKKKKLMADDTNVNPVALKSFVKDLVSKEKDWSNVMEDATEHCFGHDLEEFVPPNVCQPLKYVYCIAFGAFLSCPENHWKDTDDCKKVASFINECADSK